jgi:uncharacterized protein YdeI (YjbR/CyaY-like superfamily)
MKVDPALARHFRKAVMGWIVSARQEATRQRRLSRLIEHGERGAALHQPARP